jgi:hypothetical protein
MLAVLAAGVLGAGSSWAQMPGGAQGEGPEGMGPMRGFERLHKQLKLNPQQEELWKKAQATQREVMQKTMAAGREQHAKLRAEIDQPGVDLKQFMQHMDQMHEQLRAQMGATHKQVRDAWFAVYDALDAAQKEQVRVAIREGMDRMGRMHRGPRSGQGAEQGAHG